MTSRTLNVLFLCTHNAARSIIAQALLNASGAQRFRAYSAGSRPREDRQPHPMALRVLREASIDIRGLESKSWDVFALPDAPHMDLIITVCDHAAGEVCPVWPGHPATAHWGYPDPSQVQGSEEARHQAFRATLHAMQRRIDLLASLPDERLQAVALQQSARDLAGQA